MFGTKSPTRPVCPAPSSSTLRADAVPAGPPEPLNYGEMHDVLVKTKREIKAIRGWHGSRLAVAGGVVGGVTVAGGAAAATVLTGGVALAGAAAVVGGGVVLGGGALGGWYKTYRGKHQCKQNAPLMDKVVLLTQMRAQLKDIKQVQGLEPEQRKLYRDIKKVTAKVDRSSLREATNSIMMAGAGAAGGVAGTAALAAAVLVVAAAGAGGGGGDVVCCWGSGGGGGGCGGGSGEGGSRLHAPTDASAFTGISVTPQQRAYLHAEAVVLPA